jgi:alkylation response protein AidB-like acyl-CoA dehydrogenase
VLSHMLDWYDLTDEERRIRDLAAEVAREEIAPHAEQHDRDGTFARDSIEALGRSGLLGVFVGKEYGGLGGSPLAAAMAIELVSAACGSTGMSFMFHCNLIEVVTGAGPDSLKEKYFPQFARSPSTSSGGCSARSSTRWPTRTATTSSSAAASRS